MDSKNTPNAVLALSISLTVLFCIVLVFLLRWETNDDVGMSMVAHGYGLVASGSPNIIFSNVLWGYLVRVIPAINGVLGYSIAAMGALVVFGVVVRHALRKFCFSWITSIAALLVVIVRPILFLQFTINAGLLTVGAILCWCLYAHQGNLGSLFIGCALAFGGYLARSQDFLLVFILALPLLPWGIWYVINLRESLQSVFWPQFSGQSSSTTVPIMVKIGAYLMLSILLVRLILILVWALCFLSPGYISEVWLQYI